MKIELMIYVYIAICVSMIAFNIVYVFVLRHREKALISGSAKLEEAIYRELERIQNGEGVSEKHKTFLKRSLERTAQITAFDKALENVFQTQPALCETYLLQTYPVFEYLTEEYLSKDTVKIAYFPYILQKYNILQLDDEGDLIDMVLTLLRSVNVYCRENALRAIYSTQNPTLVLTALKIIDKNLSFHHPKLICDGLLTYNGNTDALKAAFFEDREDFSDTMQLNVLNYFRLGGIRCDNEMLALLQDEETDREIRFSILRYFEKYPCEEATSVIHLLAENLEGRAWEYPAIASSALKSYPGDVTFRILVKNLSHSNWNVRQNSAISLEKLGYNYHDLISVFDGNDRYAREIMRYHLDKRKAEEAVKA